MTSDTSLSRAIFIYMRFYFLQLNIIEKDKEGEGRGKKRRKRVGERFKIMNISGLDQNRWKYIHSLFD